MHKKKTKDILKIEGSTFLDLREKRQRSLKEPSVSLVWLKEGGVIIIFIIFFLFLTNIPKNLVFAPSDSSLLRKTAAAIEEKDITQETNRDDLEQKLKEIEKEIEKYQNNILKTQKQARTLKNEIYILENRISKLNLQIKATQLTIARLNQQIKLQEEAILLKEIEINKERNLLADSLEKLYESENQSLLEITLKNSSLSDFFDDLNSMMIIQESIVSSLKKLESLKKDLEAKKEELLQTKSETVSLANLQSLQKKSLAEKQSEKKYLLSKTKGKESLYKKLLQKSQQTAAQIRSRIYELMGIGKPITFGDALKFAEFASKATGVREALILAVITQESELGKNIGTCNRKGDPPSKSWRKVMKPSRDQPAFVKVINELNKAGYSMNIDEVPVSCPMKSRTGSWIGWGGAMGPAQFLPSTWLLYKNKIAKLTGHYPPNPWNVQDAFVAAALLLRDNGAATRTWKAEWRAAMKYFAGSVQWKYRFYGDNVMYLASKYQKDIDKLKNSQ